MSNSATPRIAACQVSLSITIYWSSLKLMSIESVMPSNHLILCHSLFLLPPITPSIRDFSNESTLLMRWSKYWSCSFSIIPSKEHPGLISFRMDWLDLLEPAKWFFPLETVVLTSLCPCFAFCRSEEKSSLAAYSTSGIRRDFSGLLSLFVHY